MTTTDTRDMLAIYTCPDGEWLRVTVVNAHDGRGTDYTDAYDHLHGRSFASGRFVYLDVAYDATGIAAWSPAGQLLAAHRLAGGDVGHLRRRRRPDGAVIADAGEGAWDTPADPEADREYASTWAPTVKGRRAQRRILAPALRAAGVQARGPVWEAACAAMADGATIGEAVALVTAPAAPADVAL